MARGNGEGSIRKRKDGRWEGRYTAGRDANGKQVQRNVLGKTRAEVKQKLDAALAAVTDPGETVSRHTDVTLGDWLDVWLESYVKIRLRPSTVSNYETMIRLHIKPRLGNVRLTQLKTIQIQQMYSQLYTDGRIERLESRRQPKSLSAKTVGIVHVVMRGALEKAVDEGLILRNPSLKCVLPKKERKEMHIIPLESLGAFLREAEDTQYYELFYTALATGLRRGELLGLQWGDLDGEVLRVQRQLMKQTGETAPLKTNKSRRTFIVPAGAVEVLSRYRAQKSLSGIPTGEADFIFTTEDGKHLNMDASRRMLARVLERVGLPPVRLHDLRHTFATMAIANGVDIKTLQHILGHYSAAFTLDVYTHATTQMQQDAAVKVGGYMDSQLRQ